MREGWGLWITEQVLTPGFAFCFVCYRPPGQSGSWDHSRGDCQQL